MDNRFDRNTFESIEFLIESAEALKIKSGGSSNSNIFNRYFAALAQDITLLATRTNILATRSSRVEKGSSAQSGALLASFQSVSTRVDAASAYSQVLADMHSAFYIDGTSTATVEKTFGQATLPVLSQTDLLVQEDVYGNKYVSSEVQISYSTNASSSINSISLESFVTDPEAIFMVREDQTWIKDTDSATKVWIRLKAPLQFRGLIPNVLEIWPFPAFGMTLDSVWIRQAGYSTSNFQALSLAYLPKYNSTTGKVDSFGPVRLHLDNLPISEIAICLNVSAVDVWGLKKLKLYHTEYDSSTSLVVKDPYSRTVGDLVLRGKDPSALSQLNVTKVGNKATINIVTTDSTQTPVITGVIMSVT